MNVSQEKCFDEDFLKHLLEKSSKGCEASFDELSRIARERAARTREEENKARIFEKYAIKVELLRDEFAKRPGGETYLRSLLDCHCYADEYADEMEELSTRLEDIIPLYQSAIERADAAEIRADSHEDKLFETSRLLRDIKIRDGHDPMITTFDFFGLSTDFSLEEAARCIKKRMEDLLLREKDAIRRSENCRERERIALMSYKKLNV
jgi:hypothetical protein